MPRQANRTAATARTRQATHQGCVHGDTPRLTDSTIPSRLATMALNIKNPHVERLAAEVAKLARESKTEAIGRALEERKARLASRVIRRDRQAEFLDFLRRDVWPKVPRKYRRRRLTRKEEDALLGYGPEGV
jgi:antitoxin VapB